MKKFYLKIWVIAFITAFVAIPAAAKVSLEDFKTQEEKDLAISCDDGDGKYSACMKLAEILTKRCDNEDFRSCEIAGEFLSAFGRYRDAIAPLSKACDANLMLSCVSLMTTDIAATGNIDRAIRSLDKICDAKIDGSGEYCKFKSELEICLKDTECNPIKRGKELLNWIVEQ